MRTTFSVALALSGTLAGCVAPVAPAPPWSIEAPVWEPGYAWDWRASEGNETYPGHLEVEAPEHRMGVDGYVLWTNATGRPDAWADRMVFTAPDRMGLVDLRGQGTMAEMCTDWSRFGTRYDQVGSGTTPSGPLQLPLVPFPLRDGMEAKTETLPDLNGLGLHWIQAAKVTGRGPLETPAGTFDAVRIEIRRWWQNDNPESAKTYRALGWDEASARAAPPAAVVYYAPEVRHVVRLEGVSAKYAPLPGQETTFLMRGVTYTPPEGVIELTGYTLERRPALSPEGLVRKAHSPPWSGTSCEEAIALAEPYVPLPTASVGFTPRAVRLPKPGASVAWQVQYPSPNATYAWRLLEGDGQQVATGAGTSWSQPFPRTGAFTVEVNGTRDGRTATARGYVVVDWNATGTLDCDAAVADGLATTLGLPAPPGSCRPVPLEIGPGVAVLDVTVRHGPEGRAPCSRLDLVDAEGAVTESVFTGGNEAHLVTIVHSGTQSLVWHPGAQGPLMPTYEAKLTYFEPGAGFSFSGGGSPGC